MLSIEALRDFGANVDEGLNRCMKNEAFYLRLVGMGLSDKNFGSLEEAVQRGDAKQAFEAAHALKGALGNLSLTPLYEPISRLTELVRNSDSIPSEAAPLVDEIMKKYQEALALTQ